MGLRVRPMDLDVTVSTGAQNRVCVVCATRSRITAKMPAAAPPRAERRRAASWRF